MRIEILCTGDELVGGQLTDTNSGWLCDRFFRLGELVARVTTVGDELGAIVHALREASSRAEVVVVSGGLGPTLDDRTVEAACAAFARERTVDEASLARITERFARVGRTPTPNNALQATVPRGARVLGNDHGTATAFALDERDGACELYFFPGVPRELHALAEEHLFPRVAARLAREGVFRCYRAVKCFGIAESKMDHLVQPLLAAHPFVRYGTRTSFPENHVKLLAEGASVEQASARCEAIERQVREVLGPVAFGGADDTFAEVVVEALRARGWTVAFAESLTAGLAAAMVAESAGASDVLLGALVTYAPKLKGLWLDVPEALLDERGVVTEACARAMAEGALKSSGASVAVALTGEAGPKSASGREVGTVYAAIAGCGLTRVIERTLPRFGRNELRRGAAYVGLELLRRRALGLEEEKPLT